MVQVLLLCTHHSSSQGALFADPDLATTCDNGLLLSCLRFPNDQRLGVCEVSHIWRNIHFIVSLAMGVCLLFTNMSLKCEMMGFILG